eukprot:1887082-Rhodomonas_salina.1
MLARRCSVCVCSPCSARVQRVCSQCAERVCRGRVQRVCAEGVQRVCSARVQRGAGGCAAASGGGCAPGRSGSRPRSSCARLRHAPPARQHQSTAATAPAPHKSTRDAIIQATSQQPPSLKVAARRFEGGTCSRKLT